MNGREVAALIAGGASANSFEATYDDAYICLSQMPVAVLTIHPGLRIRRKCKFRTVNGFEVPCPETAPPPEGTDYYVASLHSPHFYEVFQWIDDLIDREYLRRNILFLCAEHAIANTKAFCNIND